MITPEFLQSCTDEQINKGVAWLEASKFSLNQPCEVMAYKGDLITFDGEFSFMPCTNPNDAWPIMMDSHIGIRFSLDNGWIARNRAIVSFKENPLRAAMEVYILMECSK